MREKFNESINLNTSNEHKESTYGAKDMHRKHVQDLKKKLSAYKADPFGERNARDISTGKEVDHNIIEGLINSGERGNELLKGFIQTRLIDGTVKFYDPIKKVNLDTGLKKKKNENKVLSSVKQDRQAFGMIISNNIDLEIAFSYPITDLPLSIANIDGTLRTGQKCLLRNHLITESNAEVETSPHNASWIVDTMSIIRTMKPEKTFKDFFRKLMNIVSPPSSFQPKRLELVNDVYKNRSIKSMARLKRGENAQRTHVNSVQQNILKGNDWTKCFKNNDNKNDLLHQISEFLKEVDVRNQLQIPVRINDMFDTIEVTTESCATLFTCNHEEADTRMIYHALREDIPIVIVSKDTDVLLLMIYAFSKHRPSSEWYMKISDERLIKISTIVNYLGLSISLVLPQYHVITGCDTTSYFYGTGKIKSLKKLMQAESKVSYITTQ